MAPPPDPQKSSATPVVIIVGVICVLAVGLAVAAAMGAGDGEGSTETAATAPSTSASSSVPGQPGSTIAQGPPIEVPLVAAGGTIDGETPCPAADGSSERITLFASAPPMCIDPEREYKAIMSTDAGDMELLLDPARGAQSVNNFVVLARYHYYDGMAFDGASPRQYVRVGGAIEGYDSIDFPGYTVPSEAQPTVYIPGTIGFIPGPDGSSGADIFLATYEASADLPVMSTFGMMLAGEKTLQALDKLGTDSGVPSGVVKINSIDIEEFELDDAEAD